MKKIKKLTAFFLFFILLLEILPSQISVVYANLQNPIATETTGSNPALAIDSSSSTAGTYQVNLTWSAPAVSTSAETRNTVHTDDREYLHDVEGYLIYNRNASATKAYPTTRPTGSYETKNLNWSQTYTSLSDGSLYAFLVRPYHQHRYRTGINASGGDIYTSSDATQDAAYSEAEAIYLTDITVSATGSDKSLTITWNNPRWNDSSLTNFEPFTGYRIYFTPAGEVYTESNSRDVFMTDTDLVRTDAMLEYTFEHSIINPGSSYDVKIEPLYGTNSSGKANLLRPTSGNLASVITINGKRYSISYSNRSYSTSVAVKASVKAKWVEGFVRVSWDKFGTTDGVEKIEVLRSATKITNEEGNEVLEEPVIISTLFNSTPTDSSNLINYVLDKPPSLSTVYYYQIIVYYKDRDPSYSNIDDYDPSVGDYQISKPTILKVETPSPDDDASPYLDIYWEAFWRDPVLDEELSNVDEYGKILDENLIYDIWVTDDRTNFDKSGFLPHPVKTLFPEKDLADPVSITSGSSLTVTGKQYNYKITEYTDSSYDTIPLDDNKLYYVRIVARRTDSAITDIKDTRRSEYSYWAEYILLGDPLTRPLMISKPPLSLKETTEESITIKWHLKWYEAYNKNDNSWYSLIGAGENGPVFGEETEANNITAIKLYGTDYDSKEESTAKADIRKELMALGIAESDLPALRLMDLTNASYEIHVAEFDYVEEQGGYEAYYDYIKDEDGEDEYWETITRTGGTAAQPEYTITSAHAPKPGGLEQNTTYVIYFRPYTLVSGRKVPYFSNYILAATDYTREPIDIVPTVPVLEEDSEGDTYLRVKWKYNDQLEYQLAYGELLSQYSDGGTEISWEDLKATGTIDTENGYFYYTVNDLFPDTPYYLWIWAIAKNSDGDKFSAPSNPIYMVTLDIQAPPPPNGLSLASKENVNKYNIEASTTYVPAESDYIIIEWLLNYQDEGDAGSATGSGPAAGLSTVEWLSGAVPDATYLARFAELTANKRYYFRAKTIFTVTKSGDTIEKIYNYVVQISDTEDFTDYVEITIPPPETTDPIYTKQKESEWTTVISIVSETTDEEYDGDKNPEQYPLPAQDFEFLYDAATDTLTLRFRSNKTDANGNRDNNVDQRFISRLLQNRTYVYDVDLSRFNNKTVTNRVLEMPYSIFAAFLEHKISLRVIADDLTVTLPAEAALTSEIRALSDLGYSSTIKISLAANPAGLPSLTLPIESYASTPQKLTMQVITPSRTVNLSGYGANIRVGMKLSNRHLVIDKNVGSYQSTSNVPGWERVNADYDDAAGTMAFQTAKAGTYAVIAREAPLVTTVDSSYDAVYNVTSRLNIKDLTIYDPLAQVNALQFHNLAAAVAREALDVNMNSTLSDRDYNALRSANLLINDSFVSREAGVNALIRLYELKTKRTIRTYSSLQTTAYPDIAGAAPAYQPALLKAGDLGFYGDGYAANPKAILQLGELLYIIDIIMQDAGI